MSGYTTPSLSASTPTLYDPNEVPTERTHLLGKQKETPSPLQRTANYGHVGNQDNDGEGEGDVDVEGNDEEGKEVEVYEPGKATFGQTLLNVLGDLIGTGLLACPIAIAHAGWVLGPICLFVICGVTLWTLKIVIRIIEKDRTMRNFADVARYGLGDKAEKWITGIFVGDCCIWLIALIVLFSDSLEAVWPLFSSNQWKIVGLVVIIPLNFVPLRYLSYTSFLGVSSTWTLVCILLFTGIVTPSGPGSIRDPSPTDLWPVHGWVKLGISFGLLLSGFGGHFLIPNLIRDMKKPKQAEKVVEVAYGISMFIYILVAGFGYLMYGRDVSDEISRDLAKTPTFSPVMAKVAVWMVALNPLTKLPLALRPLCDVIYTWLHLQPTMYLPNDKNSTSPISPVSTSTSFNGENERQRYVVSTSPPLTPTIASSTSTLLVFPPLPPKRRNRSNKSPAEIEHDRKEIMKKFLRPVTAIVLILLFVLGSFILPSFETVMSIMGGGLSVINCILIPIAAGAGVWGWNLRSKIIFGISSIVVIIGLVCAVLNDGSISI